MTPSKAPQCTIFSTKKGHTCIVSLLKSQLLRLGYSSVVEHCPSRGQGLSLVPVLQVAGIIAHSSGLPERKLPAGFPGQVSPQNSSLPYLVVGGVICQCISKMFKCLLVHTKLGEKQRIYVREEMASCILNRNTCMFKENRSPCICGVFILLALSKG